MRIRALQALFVLGVVGLVRPASLVRLVEFPWRSRTGLYVAIAFRIVLGILLVAAASSTRFPWIIGALGVLSLIAAVLIPVLGYDRIRGFVEWWAQQPEDIPIGTEYGTELVDVTATPPYR